MSATPRLPRSAETPIVRRLDHIVIRVDDPYYDDVYSLLADVFHLPTPWPPTEHPTLRSGGIFAGNVDFEILYVPGDWDAPPARLFGLVFEAWSDDLTELAGRGIGYLPAPYLGGEPGQPPTQLWMNYFLGPFLGSTPWLKALFALKRLLPDRLWIRSARRSSSNRRAVELMFNKVYRHGMVFLVRYNPAWRNIDAERRISAAQLAARSGGRLGLQRVKEVVIGATQLTASSHLWRTFLRPASETTALRWQVGDGPALRVIAADTDGLHHMIWEVASLAKAQAALEEMGLLGAVMADEIILDPARCFGLDIRLVEG